MCQRPFQAAGVCFIACWRNPCRSACIMEMQIDLLLSCSLLIRAPLVSCVGVRSVSFQGHILTSGSGRGHLAFYDLRAARYLNLGPDPQQTADVSEAACCSDREHLQLGRGWLVEDSIYWCATGSCTCLMLVTLFGHAGNFNIENACMFAAASKFPLSPECVTWLVHELVQLKFSTCHIKHLLFLHSN